MTLDVYTARIGRCRDQDGLDVTRKSATTAGLVFAPSWKILAPALSRRRAVDRRPRGRQDLTAREQAAFDWAEYSELYLEEMRASCRRWRPAWDALLARPRVVLLCYCADPTRCHRAILRRRILPCFGARDCGELVEDDR